MTSEGAKIAIDISILSAAVVVGVLIVVAVVVSGIVKRLHCLVAEAANPSQKPAECAGWLARRAARVAKPQH